MSKFGAAFDLLRSMRRAASSSGRSVAEIGAEIARLRRRAHLFGVSDYFTYRLYLDPAPGSRKEDFAGWQMEDWLNDRLNPKVWRGIAEDKCIFLSVCATLGLPVPRTVALYHRGGRTLGATPTLRDPEAAAHYLRTRMDYPFFAKPVFGTTGGGAMAVDAIDHATDELVLADGSRRTVGEFVASLERRSPGVTPEAGYLMQARIRQHPEVEQLAGTTVGCVRFVVLVGDDGPIIHQVVWKVPAGRHMTDHFRYGRTGNLVAGIDSDTGRITRVVRGVSFEQSLVEVHPDSGRPLVGWSLPQFQEASALVMRAATQFPMLRFQHWDLAMADSGPLIVELNSSGSIFLPQLGTASGLFDERLRQFVARYSRTPR